MKEAFCRIEGRDLADHEARAIVKGIEHLRETFAPFVAASPDTVPNYASVPYRPKGGRQSYQITPCPDRAGFYIVTIARHDKNQYGMPLYQPETVTVWVHVKPLHMPTRKDACHGLEIC